METPAKLRSKQCREGYHRRRLEPLFPCAVVLSEGLEGLPWNQWNLQAWVPNGASWSPAW